MELRCGHIKIVIVPCERLRESPESLRCKVHVVISHPTGAFQYQADDIYLGVADLIVFGDSVERLIADAASEACQSCLSEYFRIRIARTGNVVNLAVEVEEYVPNPKLIGSSTEENGELLGRWREVIQNILGFDD